MKPTLSRVHFTSTRRQRELSSLPSSSLTTFTSLLHERCRTNPLASTRWCSICIAIQKRLKADTTAANGSNRTAAGFGATALESCDEVFADVVQCSVLFSSRGLASRCVWRVLAQYNIYIYIYTQCDPTGVQFAQVLNYIMSSSYLNLLSMDSFLFKRPAEPLVSQESSSHPRSVERYNLRNFLA